MATLCKNNVFIFLAMLFMLDKFVNGEIFDKRQDPAAPAPAYEVIAQRADYSTATQLCADLGAYTLPMPKTQAENDALNAFTSNADFYLGLSDAVTEGVWLWADGSSLAWTNWLEGAQPNGGEGENHVVMMKELALEGYGDRWADEAADHMAQQVVCQAAPTGTTTPSTTTTQSSTTATPCQPLRKALQCLEEQWLYIDCDAQWGGQIAVEKVIFGNDENATVSRQECPSHNWLQECSNSQSTIDRLTRGIKNRCDGRAGCSQLVHRHWWGDTCHSHAKYMKVYYRCVDALPEALAGPSHTIFACTGGNHKANIICDPKEGTHIHIQKVWYGSPPDRALAEAACPSVQWQPHCVPRDPMMSKHFQVIRNTCEGKGTCLVSQHPLQNVGDSCPTHAKNLMIVYNCYN